MDLIGLNWFEAIFLNWEKKIFLDWTISLPSFTILNYDLIQKKKYFREKTALVGSTSYRGTTFVKGLGKVLVSVKPRLRKRVWLTLVKEGTLKYWKNLIFF